MTNYISSIKNWFKSDYEGRHLELILLEIAKFRPQIFADYLCDAVGAKASDFKNARYEIEVTFNGKYSMRRRADLGVFRDGEAEPFILIEIKYFDKPLLETEYKAGQFEDYRFWKSSGGSHPRYVLILSREILPSKGLVLHRWDRLARSLQTHAAKSDLVQILVEFLEEEGIVMQNVDNTALQRYFIRLVCQSKNNGKISGNLEGPVEFSKVLKNLQIMSGPFTHKFKEAWKNAGLQINGVASSSNVASIDFRIQNKILASKSKEYRGNDGVLVESLKDGGCVQVFARHSLGHSPVYLRIEYGLFFNVPGNIDTKDDEISLQLYATAYGSKITSVLRIRKIDPSNLTTKARNSAESVERLFQELLHRTITKLLDEKNELNNQQVKALTTLQVAFRKQKSLV